MGNLYDSYYKDFSTKIDIQTLKNNRSGIKSLLVH